MNWLDIVLIVGLLVSALMGFFSGLIRILFMLAGVILGIFLAGLWADGLASKLTFISDPNIAHVTAFVIILLATMIVFMILEFVIIRLIIKSKTLGVIDKVGGSILGLLVGAIFMGAIMAVELKYFGPNPLITSSPLASFLVDKFGIVLGLLPSQFDIIRGYFT
jgi:membrane protein required for colicin V production